MRLLAPGAEFLVALHTVKTFGGCPLLPIRAFRLIVARASAVGASRGCPLAAVFAGVTELQAHAALYKWGEFVHPNLLVVDVYPF